MTQDNGDRGFKVRPLLDIMNRSFQKYGVFQEKLAVGEMIVPYHGDNRPRRFRRDEPNRLGYKLWTICGGDGYCYKVDLYCGKEQGPELCGQPLGSRVVLDMISVISDPSGHEVFFGNKFTSRTLLGQLKSRGIRATGVVREKRLGKCPVSTVEVMREMKRGSYEQRFDLTDQVLLIRWHDYGVVNVMTNYDTANPTSNVDRYDSEAKKRVPVPQPKALKTYHAAMSGVDLHDQLLGAYPVSIRGKKWYWGVITRLLDIAVVNSHILHKTAVTGDKQLSLLDFRREIAVTYLKAAASQKGCGARPLPANTPASLRYDGIGHFPAPLHGRRQCQLESCKLRSTKRCNKCDVAICLKCFVAYHQRS
ncbi:piggyBac transposable element-derived protein 2-like [Amphibalanus amphitrite]|uniref:piggyBac transposable element-derived protein 2-like n=1 Tax=Amphibalanus amphitrite TaxID=1232801 RepID=UPI001C9284F5|nr:piggyBac transposable element-derived protein 2-like [Amphibalanus amphitrite]